MRAIKPYSPAKSFSVLEISFFFHPSCRSWYLLSEEQATISSGKTNSMLSLVEGNFAVSPRCSSLILLNNTSTASWKGCASILGMPLNRCLQLFCLDGFEQVVQRTELDGADERSNRGEKITSKGTSPRLSSNSDPLSRGISISKIIQVRRTFLKMSQGFFRIRKRSGCFLHPGNAFPV